MEYFMKLNNIINKIKSINPNIMFVGEFDDNNQKTGYWEVSWQNGYPHEHGYYLNGLKDGPWTIFYSNGKLKTNCFFKENKMDGKIESYFINGNINLTGTYVNGLRHGEWVYYNEMNHLEYIKIFYNNGHEVK
jgi:antitoxin component YwqK of YwqJK toxin-antitoxin module